MIELTYELLNNLTGEYGFPLYIYDESAILNKVQRLKQLNMELLYSMKCNPNSDIVRLMASKNVGIDAASANEVLSAAKIGHKPENIFYSSPGKRECDIINTIDKCFIVADSLNELKLINSVCKKQNRIIEIGVRVNPANELIDGNAFEIMSGVSSKFGIDSDLLIDCLTEIKNLKNIEITGIHIYFGSQILDTNVLCNNFKIISAFALYLKEFFNIKFIDFGGGYGVKFEQYDTEPDLAFLSEYIHSLPEIRKLKDSGVRLITESGRYLVSEAGYFVTEIVDTKISRGEKYLIVRGGMNGFFRPIFLSQYHEILVFPKEKNIEYETVSIGGDLCTPIDMFAKNISLPKADIGDIVVIKNAGAYGLSMSLTNFISHDAAKEIFYTDGGTICS